MTAGDKGNRRSTVFPDVKSEELADISRLRIDSNGSLEERRRQYLNQVGNPYMVRVGDVVVKISFSDSGSSFEEAFENLLSGAGKSRDKMGDMW